MANESYAGKMAGKRDVTSDMQKQNPLSITGGRPDPNIVAKQDQKQSSDPPQKTRYSDEELQEFKLIILGKLEKAQHDYEMYKSAVNHSDSNDTHDTSPTFKVLEEGAATLLKEESSRLALRQYDFIQHLKAALGRIESKNYGLCVETGKLIPKERLKLVPHTMHSIGAKC